MKAIVYTKYGPPDVVLRLQEVQPPVLNEGEALVRIHTAGLNYVDTHLVSGDPVLASNIVRRTDFALFMVDALTNDALIHAAPAIVGCRTPSALANAAPEKK